MTSRQKTIDVFCRMSQIYEPVIIQLVKMFHFWQFTCCILRLYNI